MEYNSFLYPAVLQDTPRLFTALAEWLAVFVYFNIYKRRLFGIKYGIACVFTLLLESVFQFLAGIIPLMFWIPSMILAVCIMYFSMFLVLNIKPMDCGVLTIHAFVLAEFAASLYRQLYVWIIYFTANDNFRDSFVVMLIVYGMVFMFYFNFERGNIPENEDINILPRELAAVLATGFGAFIMGNLSFVWTTTPFSDSDNILYVRTLVDFGGMLMLMTQMGRRNEMNIKAEKYAVDQLFTRQYEQYKLAVDNSELLRREMHDMKHYVIALKNEDDASKRAEILANMEQAIAIQQSFMDTGNQVLDVILTTKSLQCEKQHITLNAMVDGDVLKGVHVKDICSLFGNILDNAIEATQQVVDEDKRLITLNMRQKNRFIIIECTNYTEVMPEMEPLLLPKTTKADNVRHGYGLKSIKKVAEKYGGAINVSIEDGWFKVKVLLSTNK